MRARCTANFAALQRFMNERRRKAESFVEGKQVEICEKMDAALYCDDLLQSVNHLIDFAQVALLENDR
jgi:hypothetical protein